MTSRRSAPMVRRLRKAFMGRWATSQGVGEAVALPIEDQRPTTASQRPTIKQNGPPRSAEGRETIRALRFRSPPCRDRLYPAVFLAVQEIYEQPDHEPDNQTSPIDPTQVVHHVAIRNYTQD